MSQNDLSDLEKGMGQKMWWSCHICKESRRDAFISVVSYGHTQEGGVIDVTGDEQAQRGCWMVENIRYCNDNPECENEAKAGPRKTYECGKGKAG